MQILVYDYNAQLYESMDILKVSFHVTTYYAIEKPL
jgi:hypothetical protein